MLATLLNQLTSKQNQRADQLAAAYRKLVDDAACGREPDASKAHQLLADLGKTVDELKADVERRMRRDSLKSLYAKIPEIERANAAINAQRAEATRIFNEAEALYERTMEPLNDQYDENVRLQNDALRAGDELVNACDDAALIAERDQIDAEINKVEMTLPKLREQIDASERTSNAYKLRAETEIRLEADKRSIASLAEKYQADAEKHRTEVRQLEREVNALRKRREALRLKMQQA
jgi:hypothetical protein